MYHGEILAKLDHGKTDPSNVFGQHDIRFNIRKGYELIVKTDVGN